MSKPAPGPTAAPPAAPVKPAAPIAKPAPLVSKPAAPKLPGDGNGAPAPAAKPAAPVPATMDFKCPQCDEPIKIAVELAGKQAPCPACRRIIKVPALTKAEPKDWRVVPSGPSLARRDTEPAPEGAWGSATTVSTVSREALEEADAAGGVKEPWTRGQKIKWGIVSVAAGLIGAGLFIGIKSYLSGNEQQDALERAVRNLPADPLAAAEIHRAIAEYSIRAGGDAVPVGRDHLQVARTKLANHEPSTERDALLADIALLQADLILDPKEIEKAQIRHAAEREQERAFKELEGTMSLIAAPEARADALRQVTEKLLAKKLAEQAPRLVGEAGDNRTELAAAVGLELWRIGQTKAATALADQLLKARADPKLKDKPAPPSLVALAVVVKRPEEEIDKLKPLIGGDFAWRLGQIQGLAMLGDFEKARGMKAPMKDLEPLFADAVLAAAATSEKNPTTTDLEQAAACVEENKPALGVPTPGRPNSSWVLLRLTRLALRAGKADLAATFAGAVPDDKLRGRAKLEILRDRLAKADKAEDSWAEGIEGPAYALAREAIVHHNAKKGQSGLMRAIAGWDEKLRAFGFVGLALGLQEK